MGMEAQQYKLLIGIPTYGMPKCEFAIDSLGSMLFHIGRRHPEIEVMLHRDVRTYRQEARKGIVEEAQKWGATHLLMLDDDQVFSGRDFDILWKAMVESSEVQMVSGLYFTRGVPTVPCIWKLTERGTVPIFYYPDNELFKVDVVGFGFVLFDMEIFKKLNPPWFNLGFGYGEDAAFCARVLQGGLGVYVHTGAKIGHLLEQPHVITEADYLPTRDRHREYSQTGQLVPAGYIGKVDSEQRAGSGPVYRPSSKRRWFHFGWKKDSTGRAVGAGDPSCGQDPDIQGGEEGECPSGQEADAKAEA
jgi:hypothetical protein